VKPVTPDQDSSQDHATGAQSPKVETVKQDAEDLDQSEAAPTSPGAAGLAASAAGPGDSNKAREVGDNRGRGRSEWRGGRGEGRGGRGGGRGRGGNEGRGGSRGFRGSRGRGNRGGRGGASTSDQSAGKFNDESEYPKLK